ncbi:IS3 family transposase [Teredinibacter turnerae]|uniref:IS3 family transposase n=1 Tax=Teredinibacter turnerae TaxID=2426 RepID=UPI001E2A6663|nr:IS3 family transposase [Teredinibacter turnerae]
MDLNKSQHSIALMCRLYGVSRHGYNSWRRRGESRRKREDSEIYSLINRIFQKHQGCYGSPKITQELRKQGVNVGQKRVARLMQEHGLKAVKARMYRTKAYQHVFQKASPNRIKDFTPTGINQLWVADVTYIRMPDESWQYLSVIMDRYSRRIISWSLGENRTAELTSNTLARAMRNRKGAKNVILHSDKGIEYIATSFRRKLHHYGMQQSMNGVKQMNDNAHIESFFQDFKTERIKRKAFNTVDELRGIISEYMRYYNHERSHSVIGYISPAKFESRIAV